jgi:hypothetical protein
MCTDIVPGKHRPKEGETKWFEAEREPRRFEGGEEEA